MVAIRFAGLYLTGHPGQRAYLSRKVDFSWSVGSCLEHGGSFLGCGANGYPTLLPKDSSWVKGWTGRDVPADGAQPARAELSLRCSENGLYLAVNPNGDLIFAKYEAGEESLYEQTYFWVQDYAIDFGVASWGPRVPSPGTPQLVQGGKTMKQFGARTIKVYLGKNSVKAYGLDERLDCSLYQETTVSAVDSRPEDEHSGDTEEEESLHEEVSKLSLTIQEEESLVSLLDETFEEDENMPPMSLGGLARTSDFQALFSNPDIDTYIVVAYAFQSRRARKRTKGDTAYWRYNFSRADYAREKAEFESLSKYLSLQYPLKRFILQTWESDWAVLSPEAVFEDPVDRRFDVDVAENMTRWIAARQEGVEMGRAAAAEILAAQRNFESSNIPGKGKWVPIAPTVFHAVEVNLVEDSRVKAQRRVVTDVLPRVTIDLVSYACQDSQMSPGALVSCIKYILERARTTGYFECPVYIGAFGLPMSSHSAQQVAKTFDCVQRVAMLFRLPYVCYWQLYNNSDKRHDVALLDESESPTDIAQLYLDSKLYTSRTAGSATVGSPFKAKN